MTRVPMCATRSTVLSLIPLLRCVAGDSRIRFSTKWVWEACGHSGAHVKLVSGNMDLNQRGEAWAKFMSIQQLWEQREHPESVYKCKRESERKPQHTWTQRNSLRETTKNKGVPWRQKNIELWIPRLRTTSRKQGPTMPASLSKLSWRRNEKISQ